MNVPKTENRKNCCRKHNGSGKEREEDDVVLGETRMALQDALQGKTRRKAGKQQYKNAAPHKERYKGKGKNCNDN